MIWKWWFEIEGKEHRGRPRKFVDEESIALFDENRFQLLQKLADSLNVDLSTISKYLTIMRIVQKQRIWMRHKLKPRTFFHPRKTAPKTQNKTLLHRSVSSDEKWIYYGNTIRKKVRFRLVNHYYWPQHRHQNGPTTVQRLFVPNPI